MPHPRPQLQITDSESTKGDQLSAQGDEPESKSPGNIPVGSSDDEIVASLDASATSKSEPIVEEVEDDGPDKTHSGETEGMTLKWMLDAWITTDH